MSDRYVDLFLEEAAEQLEELNQNLLRLERNPEDMEIVAEIFRIAHTLKSSAAFVGLDHLSNLNHHMEDILHLIREGKLRPSTDLVTLLFQCLDRIRESVRVFQTGTKPDDTFTDLVGSLVSLQASATPAVSSSSGSSSSSSASGQVPSAPYADSPLDRPSTFTAPIQGEEKLTLSDAEKEMLQGQAKDARVFEGNVRLDADAPMKSLRFLLLFQGLQKAGTIFKSIPSAEDLDAGKSGPNLQFIFYGKITSAEVTRLCQVDMVEEVRVSERQTASRPQNTMAEDTNIKTRNIKVSSEKIDYLLNNVGELVITNSGLQKIYEDLQGTYADSPLLGDLKTRIDQAARIARDLQSGIMKTRMIPVGLVFHRFTRPVRDLALELGKQVDFEFTGEDTELDKNIIDALHDPVLHLVRNSLDHGIESPAERKAAGKPETAKLVMNAYQGGNNIFLAVRDDGRGLNREAILARAKERGLVSDKEVLSDDDVYQFIFHPGFSTVDKVTDLSGRGVGMNVVKKMAQEFKGTVTIQNVPGQGCSFILSFPLTLAIVSAILVRVAEEQYAFPLSDVIETIKIESGDITTLQGRDIIHLRGDILPIFRLTTLMGSYADPESDEFPVVITTIAGRKTAFVVDEMVGKKEIVIKSLEQNYQPVHGLIGACLMGDGSIVMVVDVQGLMDLAQREFETDSSLRALDAINSLEGGPLAATRKYNEKIAEFKRNIGRRKKLESEEDGVLVETGELVTAPLTEVVRETASVSSSVPARSHAPSVPSTSQISSQISFHASGQTSSHTQPAPVRATVPPVQHAATFEIRNEDIPRLNSIITGGMNQAGVVLSQLLGAKVDVSIPEYQAIEFRRLKEFLPRDPVVGVLISTDDPFQSMLLLVFDEETGYRAAADLMGMPASAAKEKSISEEDLQSVLSELTNIVTASILNELANRTGISIPPSVPSYLHATGAEVIQLVLSRDATIANRRLLYFSTDFYRGETELLGRIFFMPREESLPGILSRIKS